MLFISLLSLASLAVVRAADETTAAGDDNPWATFPSVPKTASINGFADRIYDLVPACAQECLRESTRSTPCPYWDTGCLCVMPQFAGNIGNCVAENCRGEEIGSFESLATSLCSTVGVWEPYWMIPASVSSALAEAATAADVEATTTSEDSAPTEETTAAETTAPEEDTTTTSAAAEETTEAPTTEATTEATSEAAEGTTSAAPEEETTEATTSAPASSAAAESSAAGEESVEAQSSSAAEASSVSVEVANAGHIQTAGGVIAAVAAVAAFF
ncbi:Repressed by TUP1 protein 5 [Candida viswanathii]|jgi:hypothetical protein|uniref:Repressed by TUP1 protein 5 n=1 Tax=Candida viswanathii TaxID=5486 RepID=A0A367Y1C4_9ASCO|nr:Repressed by TUP1 protein 5 [Candida viswanathii]